MCAVSAEIRLEGESELGGEVFDVRPADAGGYVVLWKDRLARRQSARWVDAALRLVGVSYDALWKCFAGHAGRIVSATHQMPNATSTVVRLWSIDAR